jgi:hypothetical protein
MKEIQVPGGEIPSQRPAQRWSVEMDEFDAVRELREQYSDSVEDVLDFTRGDSREMVNRTARQIIGRLNPELLGDTDANV